MSTSSYIKKQKQKERLFYEQDLEKALARIEGREDTGLTSLEDVDGKLAEIREESLELTKQSRQILGDSLLAMARPGSTYAILEESVRTYGVGNEILTDGLIERHHSYSRYSQEVFAELNRFLKRINFDSIRGDLKLDSMEIFGQTVEWLIGALDSYEELMISIKDTKEDLSKEDERLRKIEKKILLTLKNLADKSLDGNNGSINIEKFAKPNEELARARADIGNALLQRQLCLSQESLSIDNVLHDLDSAAGKIGSSVELVTAVIKQLGYFKNLDLSSYEDVEPQINDLLGEFDRGLVDFILKDVDSRFAAGEISLEQQTTFLDFVGEQVVFQRQLLYVYDSALEKIKETAEKIFYARREFGKDVLTVYKNKLLSN
ncbi:MAG: hypothetical protein LBG64_01865 [Pseudomonadales bacterium]|jgi:hypothetical protein|nr:hypothetical protein [Pseudomonadales bacterium]